MKYQKKCILRLYSPYNYWFCYENEKKKKNYPRVYLEECKYKLKKIKMSKFITTELKSKSELKSDIELESKSELESDSEWF